MYRDTCGYPLSTSAHTMNKHYSSLNISPVRESNTDSMNNLTMIRNLFHEEKKTTLPTFLIHFL